MNSHSPCAVAAMRPSFHHGLIGNVRVEHVPAHPQPVLAPLTPAAIFLVVTVDEGGEEVVHDALPEISGLVRATGFRDPAKNLSVITSIGSQAWDRLFEGPRPAELHPFVELDGPRHTAPARRATCCSMSGPRRWTSASSWPITFCDRWPAR